MTGHKLPKGEVKAGTILVAPVAHSVPSRPVAARQVLSTVDKYKIELALQSNAKAGPTTSTYNSRPRCRVSKCSYADLQGKQVRCSSRAASLVINLIEQHIVWACNVARS